MKQKRVAIVAKSDVDWVSSGDFKSYAYIIGIDRGAFVLLKKGIIPDAAIGDFDSVSETELKEIRTKITNVKHYAPDKDQTDLELAVSYALTLYPEEIALFGVTGGRLDQGISAFHLLRIIHEQECRAVLLDEHNLIILVSGNYRIKKQKGFPYLSVLPCTDDIEITMKGCKYPLHNHIMKRGVTLGISNVITSPSADITIHKGIAYVVLSRDGRK